MVATAQTRRPGVERNGSVAARGGREARSIRPRRGLPGGRAVVGGLLVAVAAVGIFAAVSGAGKGPTATYVVAARDIGAGQEIAAADVETTAVDLPDGLRGKVFSDVETVVGAIAFGPVAEGEMVQAGNLAEGVAVPTFSLALPEADANGGDLARGDLVQVLATYGTDTTATTLTLAEDVRVVSVADTDATVGGSGEVLLRLAVPKARDRAKILNATVSGRIALIRTTGVDDPLAPPSFRPDLDADTAASGEATTTAAPASGDGDGGGGSGSGG